MKSLANYIKEQHMTIKSFCQAIHCSRGPVNRINEGLPVSVSIAYRIERLTGIPLSVLGIKISTPSIKNKEVKSENLDELDSYRRIDSYMDKVHHTKEIGCKALIKAIQNVRLRN